MLGRFRSPDVPLALVLIALLATRIAAADANLTPSRAESRDVGDHRRSEAGGLDDIQRAGAARVLALTAEMATATGERRALLARRVIEAKREIRLDMERARRGLAGESGARNPFLATGRDPVVNGMAPAPGATPAAAADNLDNSTTQSGWSAPIVARSTPYAGGGYAPTATLTGDAPGTSIYFSVAQSGPETLPTWEYTLSLDGTPILDDVVPSPAAPGVRAFHADNLTVRGGRHTLSSTSDPLDQIAETNEQDNRWSEQYVWSPLATSFETPLTRPAPGPQGTGPLPNGDGFSYTRATAAWVVSMTALETGDDYDLALYNDYFGSRYGFSSLIDASYEAAGVTDFVVGDRSAGPTTLYPEVQRFHVEPAGGFVIDQSDARNRFFPSGEVNATGQTLPSFRIADVYEITLNAGETRYVTLRRRSGSSDLSCGVYPFDLGGAARVMALKNPDYQSAALDYLTFAATATGDYPLVVYRDTNGGLADPVGYDLSVSSTGPLGVPGGSGADAGISFAGARPSPMGAGGHFEFALAAAGHARVVLFDAGGRAVRTLADREFTAGPQSLAWDGAADGGHPLATGVYWARLEAGGHSLVRRVVLLR
jgi:flagellar hook capping protein FlgD